MKPRSLQAGLWKTLAALELKVLPEHGPSHSETGQLRAALSLRPQLPARQLLQQLSR